VIDDDANTLNSLV